MRLTIMLLAITSIMTGCVTRQEISVESDAEPSDSILQWPQRWLDLGMHGELIASRRYQAVGNRLKIMPKDGGFALVHTGPKWSGTYAVVQPDCKIKIIPPVPEEMDLHSAAKYWPYRDDKGFPAMPPYGTVIATKHSVNPPDITPPENMIGWLFLCADGEFYTPKKDVPVHANTLWVVSQDDGLQIIRTGPEKKGEVYATVTLNREVTFAPGVYEGPPLYWVYLNPQEKPIIPQKSYKWFPWHDSSLILTIHPDGSISTVPPPIP